MAAVHRTALASVFTVNTDLGTAARSLGDTAHGSRAQAPAKL